MNQDCEPSFTGHLGLQMKETPSDGMFNRFKRTHRVFCLTFDLRQNAGPPEEPPSSFSTVSGDHRLVAELQSLRMSFGHFFYLAPEFLRKLQ